METFLAICLGVGLSAAVGFRVFLPLFVVGLASATGFFDLPESAQWLATRTALIAFGLAMLFELIAYMIPWVDHLLDVAATPLAIAAGTLLAASFLGDLPPALRWTLAIVAGGGASATTQGLSVAGRVGSTATTGGLANPLVSTAESVASLVTTLLTLLLPIAVAVTVFTLALLLLFRRRRAGSLPA